MLELVTIVPSHIEKPAVGESDVLYSRHPRAQLSMMAGLDSRLVFRDCGKAAAAFCAGL